jgi:hypothetical protein
VHAPQRLEILCRIELISRHPLTFGLPSCARSLFQHTNEIGL